MRLSFFDNRRDNAPKHIEFPSFSDLADALGEHVRRGEKDGDLLSPAEYRDGATRSVKGVLRVHFAMLDLDHLPEATALDVLERLEGLGVEHWLYSTWSHTDVEVSLRVALALSRPVEAGEWRAFWTRLHAVFPESDPACKDASRIYYAPSLHTYSEIDPINEYHPGRPLDVDEVLARGEVAAEVDEAAPITEGTDETSIGPEVRSWCRGQIERWAQKIRATPPGAIYPVLNPAAFAAGRYTPHILPVEEVRATLARAHRERNDDPESIAKNDAILDRGLADGAAAPWRPSAFYELTDAGLADRLYELHGPRLRYVSAWRKWAGFDGRVWQTETEESPVVTAIKRLRVTMLEESAYVPEARAKALRDRSRSLGALSAARSVAGYAQRTAAFHVSHKAFDTHPMLLVCGNGVVDLRNASLHEPIPDHFLTRATSTPYDAAATCPTWDRFLREIAGGDHDLVSFLQRAVGYSLTGSTSEHALFFLYGDGANGKSTFLDTIGYVLGDIAGTVPGDLLLVKKGEAHPTGIAALHGLRFAASSEVEEGRGWDEPLVKALTGSDIVTARRMREDFWTFTPTHKFWIAGNYRPTVRGTDGGIWRRLRLVPFVQHFAEPDRTLGAQLIREAPGILAWAVRGALEWQRYGLGSAGAVEAATEAYREESNAVGEFLAEGWEVTRVREDYVSRDQLFAAYQVWAARTGAHTLTARGLCERVRRIAGVREGRKDNRRVWEGLKVIGRRI